jgi:type I restriction enzyme S subunit
MELREATLNIVDSEHKTAPQQETGIPYVKTSDIEEGHLLLNQASKVSEETYEEWTQRLEPEPGDIILTREAPVGRVGIVPEGERVCLGQRTVLIRPDPEVLDGRYLLYLLRSGDVQREFKALSSGSTVDHLNLSDLRSFELPELPPLNEQKRIGETLGNIDKKIKVNEDINNTLEEIERTIFKSWFVDFEPYSDYKDSELGEIPSEFEIKTISEFAKVILGNSPKSDFYNEDGDGLPFFQGSKNFGLRYPEIERYCTKKKKIAEPDDVLISIRAPVGDINKTMVKCIVGRGVTALRMNDHSNEYLYHLLKAKKHMWEKYKSGTTFNSINKGDIQDFPVALPPKEDIEKFNRLVKPMSQKFKENVKENEHLADLRDTLLPELVSREVMLDPDTHNS